MSADEVVEDYRSDLQYLTTNDRYAINNLTIIAKENTEHADAISTVLVDHIAKAHPNHKLPALYVLDSIAKNIGTPYTLFLGHRLFNTFMDAYSLVGRDVRRKLDEMLKTWKQPAPGSMDTRPLFDPVITKRIETALTQAKAKIFKVEQEQQRQQHELLRGRQGTGTPSNQWRNTPTPPQNDPRHPTPVNQGIIPYPTQNGASQKNSPFPQYPQFPAPGGQYQPPMGPDVGVLNRDIESLVQQSRTNFAMNPHDSGIQTKLKALLDLQRALATQNLPPDQLQAVRAQVDQLQAAQRPTSTPSQPPPMMSTAPPIIPIMAPQDTTYHPPPATNPPSQPAALPSSDFLSNLLASVAKNKSPQPNAGSNLSSILPQSSGTPAENPLIAQLRASGLLSGVAPAPASAPAPSVTPQIPANLMSLLRPPLAEKKNDVELTTASLKKSRLELMSKLYEDQPNQCLTCGKRFTSDEQGKEEKARHMDWHFRTNQRLADTAQRGQSRSWYVDELEWIRFKESGDENDQGADGATGISKEAASNDPKTKYVPVPSDSSLANQPCPICQEKFETSWNDEIQDFVWMDAVRVGGRIYHASCYADFKKDGGTPGRVSTPDSVLGKRKAEADGHNPSPAKLRKDSEDV